MKHEENNHEFDLFPMEQSNLPCIVELRHFDGNDKVYGPFTNWLDATVWVDDQVKLEPSLNGRMVIRPLRTPDRNRSYLEWWTLDSTMPIESVEEDYRRNAS